MSAFDKSLAVLFANADLAKDATYFAGGASAGTAARVIMKSADELTTYSAARVVSDSVMADVLITDVPGMAEGDEMEIGAVRYAVQGEPQRDAERLLWSVELVPV